MVKKMLGVFTSIVAALAVVGVAWAAGSDDPASSVLADDSTSRTSVTSGSSTPSTSASTPTTSASSTSTSNGGNSTTSTSVGSTSTSAGSTSTSSGGNSTTSTSIASTTSTSSGSSTSTSFDDNGGDRDRVRVPDGRSTHTIPGVGVVIIEVRNGELILVGVSAPGWSVEKDKIRSDRIELEFRSGEAEAEFEAKIDGGRVRVEIETDD